MYRRRVSRFIVAILLFLLGVKPAAVKPAELSPVTSSREIQVAAAAFDASPSLQRSKAAPASQNLHAPSTSPTCEHLAGTGTLIRIAIVPSGFDGSDPNDVTHFERLVAEISAAFVRTEPYASNLDRFSISRADDYRGSVVNDSNIWLNSLLIEAAGVCDWNQIIAIAHNSGWAGGAPGFFSVVGSGTPPSCDPFTCTGVACPLTPTCSWDERIGYTALHETGHTFARLRHTCFPQSVEAQRLSAFERVSGTTVDRADPMVTSDDPINCGIQSAGSSPLNRGQVDH